jgi:hypothetical protein
MQAHADALPLAAEHPGQPWSRRPAARSVGDRCGAPEAYPAYHRSEVGIGSVVVASIWLAFFVVAAVHSLGN